MATVGVASREFCDLELKDRTGPVCRGLVGLERRCQRQEAAQVGAPRAGSRIAHQTRPDPQVDGDVDARVELSPQPPSPRSERIDPPAHGVEMRPHLANREAPAVAVVAELDHRRLTPRPIPRPSEHDDRGDQVMAVGKDIGLDDHDITDDPLDRERAVIDPRPDRLDNGPLTPIDMRGDGGPG